jgi:WD40 repeat protein
MPSTPPAPARESLGARTRRFLQGNDVFISYARADAAVYALALASELTKRKLQCYLDQWGTPPGPLSAAVLNQLDRSSMLVVVGSTAAGASPNVAAEVEHFVKTGRPIVPVNVDGALERGAWFALIRGISLTFESRDAFAAGRPSESVLSRIENAEGFTRRNKQLKRAFWATAASTAIIIGVGAAAVVRGQRELARARKATELETIGASILAAFPSGTGELPALRAAVRAAGELNTLAPDVSRPDRYPTVSPILALQTVLSNLHEKIDFDTHDRDVSAADISPDGRHVAIVEGDGYIGGKVRVFIWRTDGTVVAHWDAGTGGAGDVRFVDSGQHLALLPSRGDIPVRVYDLAGNAVAAWPAGVQRWVPAADVRTFGLIPWQGSAQVVDTSGAEVRGGFSPGLQIKEVTPGGEVLAVRGPDLYLYNDGETVVKGEGDEITWAHLLPEDEVVAITRKDVRVVDRSGAVLKRWEPGSYTISAAFAPALPVFATADAENVTLWSPRGEQKARFAHPGGRIAFVVFSPSGDRVITAAANGTVAIWDLDGEPITGLSGHGAMVTAVRFDAEARQLLTASRDGSVRLWAMANESEQRVSVGAAGLVDVAFRADGMLATLDTSRTVRFWTPDGRLHSSLQGPSAAETPPARPFAEGFAYGGLSPDGARAAVSDGLSATTIFWRISAGGITEERRVSSGALRAELDAVHGAACVVPAGGGATIVSPSGAAARVSPPGGWLYSCAFKPDGTLVATVGADSKVRFWSLQGAQISEFQTDQLQTLDVDFTPDGAALAVAGGEGTIRICRQDGSEVARCSGHTGRILGVRFSPDGSRLASIGMDNTVRVWDLSGRQLAKFDAVADSVIHEASGGDAGHRGIAFSHTGGRLAVGAANGTVNVWAIESLPELIERGRRWLASSAAARTPQAR